MHTLMRACAVIGALTAVGAVALAPLIEDAETIFAGTTQAAALATLVPALALCAAALLTPVVRSGWLALAAVVCWLAPIAAGWLGAPPVLVPWRWSPCRSCSRSSSISPSRRRPAGSTVQRPVPLS